MLLVTGAQASGKTTVGRAVAARASRGVFLDGDQFWQAVVSGRADMRGTPTPEALEQLHLRYRATAQAASVYARAGFFTVIADNVYGEDVEIVREVIAPLRLVTVALVPSPETVARRERGRGSTAYAGWAAPERDLLQTVRVFSDWVRATPADLHHDSTEETPEQTVTAIHQWLRAAG